MTSLAAIEDLPPWLPHPNLAYPMHLVRPPIPLRDSSLPIILQLAIGPEDLRGIKNNLFSFLPIVFLLSGLALDKGSQKNEILKTKHPKCAPVEAVECKYLSLVLEPQHYPHQRG